MTILRGRTVAPTTKFFPNNGASLSGIEPNGGQSYRSAGLAFGAIVCGDFPFECEFHLVRDDFQLSVDGIIGSDFLRKYSAVIDFGKSTLKLYLPQDTKLPSNQICESILDVATAVSPDVIISPESEKIEIVSPKEATVQVMEPVRSTPNLSETIVTKVNNCKRVGDVNVLDYDRIDVVDSEFVNAYWSNSNFNTYSHPRGAIDRISKDVGSVDANFGAEDGSVFVNVNDNELSDLATINCSKLNTINDFERNLPVDRVEQIIRLIDMTHCGEIERQISIKLIRQYFDIFHLEGDQLTFTDVV